MKKSMLILTTAFVCVAICSFPVQGTTYEETIDIYEYSVGGTITWSHDYDHTADPVYTATLTIVADDVDGPGNGMNGEQDEVYVNGNYLGLLNDMGYYTNWDYYPGPGNPDNPDAITTTTFAINPAWLDSMPVRVEIESAWGAEIETSTLTVIPNEPPVADAGPDQTVEQANYQGADVIFDGSASYDPEGEPLTYSWAWTGGSATGVNPTVLLPLGTHTITLTVSDGVLTDTDTVVVNIVDTTLPDISVIVSPDTLWSPNHKMVDITATVTVSDICDAEPTVVLTSVTSNEPDNAIDIGDGNTIDDIQGAEIGTEDYEFQLRAERAGEGDGRVYTITYMVTDASGNSASASATVVVPYDKE